MIELVCTNEEFVRFLREGKVPTRFRGHQTELLDFFEGDPLTFEYVRRRLHDVCEGMTMPDKRCFHVVQAILYLAEAQGLIVKENSDLAPVFSGTERLIGFLAGDVRRRRTRRLVPLASRMK